MLLFSKSKMAAAPPKLGHAGKHMNVVPRSTGNTNSGTNRPRLSLCDLVAQSAE